MNKKILLTFVLIGYAAICSGQQYSKWDRLNWLVGDWIGEGSGKPGQGSGTFSFHFDLDRNILIRKSHSEYPATDSTPMTIHDDLMIVYLDSKGNPGKAIYFDNEGHTIFYTITFSDRNIVLTSDKIPDTPVFRLIYTDLGNETVNTRFEMSQEGDKFLPYIEGKSIRKKPGN